MNILNLKNTILLLSFTLILNIKSSEVTYDCKSPAPEMEGLHNMVLFGTPGDKLYSYHLPLFAGEVNGKGGHVPMHVYQGIWNIKLDEATWSAYQKKFQDKFSEKKPFPFFSFLFLWA